SASASTSIAFSVWADGVKLYESGTFGYNDKAEEIFVTVPQGTKTLTLKTDDLGSNGGDHSAWGNPRILTDPGVFDTFREIVASTGKSVYLTGSAVKCYEGTVEI
ncbi:MAG: NPCBM/NEW2 domain-containing protein, partial [Oscillospiraceae bacterium]|nr:NPCBM/NEW2 domain-containing protein [Oscillospiraceae bacterium]